METGFSSLPSPPEHPTTPGEQRALTVLAWLVVAAVAWIVAPVGVGLLLGTLVAFALQPFYRRLLLRAPGHPALAALATTLLAMATLVGTAIGVGYLFVARVLDGLQTVLAWIRGGGLARLGGAPVSVGLGRLGLTRAQLGERIAHLIDALAGQATRYVATLLGATVGLLLALLFLGITTYYVLQEWHRLVVHVERVLPLNPRHTRALLVEFRRVGRGALLGTVITGAAQGVLAALGYAVTGVGQPVFWGVVTFLASLLPVLGTMLVWLPAGLVLIAQGHVVAGLVELAWSVGMVIGFCDYVLRPRLVGRGGTMHPLLVLVSLLGGVGAFGGIGVLLGPVVMAVFVATVRLYERELPR